MSDLSDLKNESLNTENHFMTQKANQPTFKNKVHSYKDENTKVLLYYPLTIFYDFPTQRMSKQKGNHIFLL